MKFGVIWQHLPEYVENLRVRLFADDCVLYKTVSEQEDATSLQKDLDALQKCEKPTMTLESLTRPT